MPKGLNVRELLSLHGRCRPQRPDEWDGDIELPQPIARFYDDVGPINIFVRAHGDDVFIPRLQRLWKLQEGYRWNALTLEPVADWKPEWLVVANQGGDAFIHDSTQDCILFAEHGMGGWDPDHFAPSIGQMAACLASLGMIVKKSGSSLYDAEDFISEVFFKAGIRALTKILGDGDSAEKAIRLMGWSTAADYA